MAQRLNDEQIAEIKAQRARFDDSPNEYVDALLADLEEARRERDEAREHRRILREAVMLMLRVRRAVSNPDLSVDAMTLGEAWRRVEESLAATEQPS